MQFVREYKEMNKKLGKEQYLVPYLMSSHPGSTYEGGGGTGGVSA